jgi:hypothetical protein
VSCNGSRRGSPAQQPAADTTDEPPAPDAPRHLKARAAVCCILIAASALLLLARLGHSALWDDEAYTALTAQGVWRTGDTSAVVGHNIVANKGGFKLDGKLRDRHFPPLMYYMAAPSVGLLGATSFAARLPFALCGLATVGVIALWLFRAGANLRTWIVMSIGIIATVSFWLYFRQARYYGPAILLSVLIAYFYLRWDGRLRISAVLSVLLLGLLATNYLLYPAVVGCLLVDYAIWRRRERKLRWPDWLVIALPQIILGALIVLTWDPRSSTLLERERTSWIAENLRLILWNLREINAVELAPGLLLLAAPLLYFVRKDKWLLRAPLAILVFSIVAGIMSPLPAPAGSGNRAEIRYLLPIIPLCIFVVARVITSLAPRGSYIVVPIALLAFGTNVLHGGPYTAVSQYGPGEAMAPVGWRSTFWEYATYLADPPPSAYRATAEWINVNVPEGAMVYVTPDFATYPLMYHAPRAVYGWQFPDPPDERFQDLPDVQIKGRVMPDYVVGFGPYETRGLREVEQAFPAAPAYREVKVIPLYWYDLTRPELFWHAFDQPPLVDPDEHYIHIFRRDGGE